MPPRRPNGRLTSAIIAIVVGQSRKNLSEEGAVEIKTAKSLPTYSAVLPKYKLQREERGRIDGTEALFRTKIYPPNNVLIEATVEVPDVFGAGIATLRDRMLAAAENRLRKLDVLEGFKEEYTIYTVAGYHGEPEKFLQRKGEIVSLIRSENLPLSPQEIDQTISDSSLQYTAHDLTIIDWDGAFCFDPGGQWHESIDLLEVANVHLLRLRVLDRELDERLESMASLIERLPRRNFLGSGQVRKLMGELLNLQVRSIEEFSHSSRDIQLIGDWYAAKLYGLISKKFHLDEWRASLSEELDNLRSLYQTASDHFGVSNQTRIEFIEIGLWLILAIGYIFIFFLDFKNAVGG
jgi:hypothetical protein